MPSFKLIIAVTATLSVASASPITVARQSNPATVSNASHDSPMSGFSAVSQAPLAKSSNIGSLDACLAACQGNPSCVSYVFSNGVCKLYTASPTSSQITSTYPTTNAPPPLPQLLPLHKKKKDRTTHFFIPTATHANQNNGIPAANQVPLAQPSDIGSLDACLATCKQNLSCVSYVFANIVCKLSE